MRIILQIMHAIKWRPVGFVTVFFWYFLKDTLTSKYYVRPD